MNCYFSVEQKIVSPLHGCPCHFLLAKISVVPLVGCFELFHLLPDGTLYVHNTNEERFPETGDGRSFRYNL